MNWYKKAQMNNFYIFEKKDDPEFMNNPNARSWEKEAIRLNNGEILYGFGHWRLLDVAKRYIGNIKNIESLGWIYSDGIYRTKIRGSEVEEYLSPPESE